MSNKAFMYFGTHKDTSASNYSIAVPFVAADKASFGTTRAINTATNLNGTIVGRFVGRSLTSQSLEWDVISCEKWWEINRWFDSGNLSFYCHYFNHSIGTWETRLFCAGTSKATPHKVNAQTGEPEMYRDASVEVMDCGVV